MEKLIQKLKEVDIMRYFFNFAIVALFSVCGLLYAQQNNIIAAQDSKINYRYSEVTKTLGEKVDNTVLMEMIKGINAQQAIDTKQWEAQKKRNEKVLDNLQELNINVILLNEKMTHCEKVIK